METLTLRLTDPASTLNIDPTRSTAIINVFDVDGEETINHTFLPQYFQKYASTLFKTRVSHFLTTPSNDCFAFCTAPTCPPELTPVNCVVDPCQFTTCPANPSATCISHYCNVCNARFFDATGFEVTDSCGE